jgi:hypothetical protein
MRWHDQDWTLGQNLRFFLLTLAAFTRRGRVTAAMNSAADRPLANEPDWLVGWAVVAFEDDEAPNAKRLFVKAMAEWIHRKKQRDEVEDLAKALAKAVFTRWRVTVPTALLVVGRVATMDVVKIPPGSYVRWQGMVHSVNAYVYLLDVPMGGQVVPLVDSVTAVIEGVDLTDSHGLQRAP